MLAVTAWAGPIPDDRITDWRPGVTVGVVDGIPSYSLYQAAVVDTNGIVDASSIITGLMASCPSGQYVKLPAGNILMAQNSSFGHIFNCALKGAGMGKTTLHFTTAAGNSCMGFGTSISPRPVSTLLVSSGATKGSTNLTVSSTSTVTVGKFIRLEQVDASYVFTLSGSQTNNQSCMLYVTGKDATHIQVFPEVSNDFTNAPQIAVYTDFLFPSTGVGIEELTIDMTNSTTATAIYIEGAFGCWLKNVEVVATPHHQVQILSSQNIEIRGCRMHDTIGGGPNHEGIDLFEDVCWSLVEDNICAPNGGFPGIILGDGRGGCCGNVVSYNYVNGVNTGGALAGGTISVNHGPHNAFNLFEGNVAQMFQSDGYFGSASDNTCYRNWFNGVFDAGVDYARAVDLNRWSYRFNFYGNVIGSNSYTTDFSVEDINYVTTLKVAYRLGYPNLGNAFYDSTTNPPSASTSAIDFNVKNTLLRTNNFNYFSSTIDAPYVGTMPASLIYTNGAPPSWVGRWPAIQPESSTKLSPIPAQLRLLGTTVVGNVNLMRATTVRAGSVRVGQ